VELGTLSREMSTKPLFANTTKKVEHDSAIRDNRHHGRVGEWLKEKVTSGSDLSIVSAYFTVSAYQRLREELDSIGKLRFLFGDPAFIAVKDSDKKRRAFNFRDKGLSLTQQDGTACGSESMCCVAEGEGRSPLFGQAQFSSRQALSHRTPEQHGRGTLGQQQLHGAGPWLWQCQHGVEHGGERRP
jgi:hypothetical protein